MLTRLALTIAIAAATYTACDRHAGAVARFLRAFPFCCFLR
jgi:hypothetical protein